MYDFIELEGKVWICKYPCVDITCGPINGSSEGRPQEAPREHSGCPHGLFQLLGADCAHHVIFPRVCSESFQRPCKSEQIPRKV